MADKTKKSKPYEPSHGLYKTPPETIDKILLVRRRDGLNCVELAERFSMPHATVHKILKKHDAESQNVSA